MKIKIKKIGLSGDWLLSVWLGLEGTGPWVLTVLEGTASDLSSVQWALCSII